MSKSVKINLIKIEITNDLIKTPKVSVSLEFGGDVVNLPNARFSHKNKVSFSGQSLTALTNKDGCGINIHILGVTGSHEKEIGVVKMSYEELVENDGETQLVRRGNDDFILEFQVLYNSVYNGRMLTEESDAPSQDSYFQVEIDQESLGRDSVSISQGKGKKSSKQATPQRNRPSFQKADRKNYNISPVNLAGNVIDNSLSMFQRRKISERLSINSKKAFQDQTPIQQYKTLRSSEPIEVKQQIKPSYPSTKTIKTIKQKQSRILRATYQDDHEDENHHEQAHSHHSNPQFTPKDYLHFLLVSLVFWYIGRLIKQF